MITLRKANQNDVDALLALAQEVRVPYGRDDILSELARAHVWFSVAQLTNETATPAAFLHAHHAGDQIDIVMIAVTATARRQGIASHLLSELIGSFRHSRYRSVHLEVRVSNLAAQELYLKLGFTALGIRKRYYSDNDEDAISMSLSL